MPMLALSSSETADASSEPSLEALLAVVAEHEKEMHENEVPAEPKESASTVVRPRLSRVGARQRSFDGYKNHLAEATNKAVEETNKQIENKRNPSSKAKRKRSNEDGSVRPIQGNNQSQPNKKSRKCSRCKKPGHTKTNCPKNSWTSDESMANPRDEVLGLLVPIDTYSD